MAFNTHKALYDGFIKRGLTPEQAKGAIASLMGESSSALDPNAVRKNDAGPGKDSFGIGQWNRGRKAALDKTAASMGTTWDDPRAQVQHVFNELDNGPYSQTVMPLLKNAATAREATGVWTKHYEGPAEDNSADRYRTHYAKVDGFINGKGDTSVPGVTAQPAAPTVAVNDYAFSNAKPMYQPKGLLSDAPLRNAPTQVASAAPAPAPEQPVIDASAFAAPRAGVVAPDGSNQPAPAPKPAVAQAEPQGLLSSLGSRLANEFLVSSANAAEGQPPVPGVSMAFAQPRTGAVAPAAVAPVAPAAPAVAQPQEQQQQQPQQPVVAPGPNAAVDAALNQRPANTTMYDFGRAAAAAPMNGLLAQGPQMPADTNPGLAMAPQFIQNKALPIDDGVGDIIPDASVNTVAQDGQAAQGDDKTKMANLVAGLTKAGTLFSQIGQRGAPPSVPGTSASYHMPTVPLTQLQKLQFVRQAGPWNTMQGLLR